MRTKKMKRLLSLLLCLCMVVGLLPTTALAVTLPDGTETGTVSATIYLDNGDGQWYPEEMKTTFAADQAGLILHLDFYALNTVVPSGWTVNSIAFYPEKPGENEWGTVFWYSGGDNGTANNKLYNTNGSYNGVFQILNFTPNGGGMGLESGTYNVLVYVSNGSEEKCYLSDESFTITDATGSGGSGGSGGPVITTTSLPTAYVGEAYSQTLTATPGTTGNALTWKVTEGTLPAGLTLTEAGVLSGTPTAAGSSTFTVQVNETVGEETLTATQELTLKVTQKLEITNETTTFNPKRGQSFSEQLTANLEGVTWQIIDGYLPSGLSLQDGAITGVVTNNVQSGSYSVTVQATSTDGQKATKEFIFQIGNLFQFNLTGNIDSDAIGCIVYLRAKDNTQNKDITLWCDILTEGTNSLPVYGAFAGATVSDVRLITYAAGTENEVVLANYSDTLTLTDGENANLTGAGDNVLVKLPEIKHGYGENANIQTWFVGSDGRAFLPGTLVAVESSFTLHASASSYGENDPLKAYDLTTATFSGAGVSGTTYTPTSGGNITLSYTPYTLTPVTVTLVQTGAENAPDLSYAKLSFTQYFNSWTYSTDAVVGTGNSCTVQLYRGVDSEVYMTNAGGYALNDNTIGADSITNGTVSLPVSSAKERDMTVLVKGKLANNDADFAKYAKALNNSVGLQAATGDKSWSIGSANLSTLLNGSSQFRLWDKNCQTALSNLVTSVNAEDRKLTLSYVESGPALTSNTTIDWEKDSYTGLTDLTVNLRGGVLFSLTYNSTSRTHMQGWWHQKNGDTDTWVRGQYCTVYGSEINTIAQYCPGNPGTWDFLLLPSSVNPNGMTWAEALPAYSGMPYAAGVSIQDNTVVKLENQTLEQRAADSAIYLTLPNSTFTGPRQFDSTNDTLVFTGHIELDEGADNKMSILRLNASADSSNVLSTQISSVVINGKTYPYTGIEDASNEKDKLICVWNRSYYEIEFSESIELPCDITVYAKPATPTSAAVLDMSVSLTDKNYGYEPVNRVEVNPPSLSVDMPDTVGGKTFTAYVTIPAGSGNYVDVYDGVDLVGRADRTGDVKITLSGASDSMLTSHELRFVLRDGTTKKEIDTYTQTVLHANGAPTLRGQSLQVNYNNSWTTIQRDQSYSFNSYLPSAFRMTAIFDNPENIKDGKVVFAVKLLNGTTRYMNGTAEGTNGTYVTDTITTSSPVIGSTVLYETDWDKVNNKISTAALPVPSDSPTANGNYKFDQTIVLDYGDVKSELPTGTTQNEHTLTEAEKQQLLQELKAAIKQIYECYNGTAGFYTIIGDGSEFFTTGQSMIGSLSSDMLPTGYTGETTFTRPLTEQQLGTELGSGSGWTRLTFTEPDSSSWGGTGAGGTTGLEIYTQQMTTDSGVSGTLTITRIGEGNTASIYETGFATAEGTGSGTPSLPDSGQYNAGGEALASGGGFSFTNLENSSSDLDVLSTFYGDVNAGAGIGGSILEFLGQKGAEGAWKAANDSAGIIGAGMSVYDGWMTSESLGDLITYTNRLLDSRCAGKLSPIIRANLQNQINNFNKMAQEAMKWNIVNTMGGTIGGVGGMMTMLSNPITGLGLGLGALGTSIVNRQQIDNVYKEAQLIRDMVQMQITKYANASGDPDCGPENDSNYRVSIDPSGIVYEAVLSNPVEGATVTLYTADGTYVPTYEKDANDLEIYADADGKPIAPNNTNTYNGSGNLTAPDVNDLKPGVLTLTTGADGRYQWMVPAGLWYVTAEKGEAGYAPGSSNDDIAAVVSSGGKKWLPVLPAQLDVNIPLVSYAIPEVTAEYRSDGVYLTFSKYMDDTTLTAEGAFKINGETATVQLLNSEQAPDNINYGTGNTAPSYTSRVMLVAATNLTGNVTVTIGSGVKSYAGVPCGATEGLTLSGTVSAATPVAKPTFTPNGGQVAYGSTVTITCGTDGATLYYTTDGSTPDKNSTRYYANQTIAIDRDMTIKVLAVKPGYDDSVIASADFTVPSDKNIYGGGTGGTGGTGGNGGGGYTPATYSLTVDKTENGSISISPKNAAKGDTVTVTVKPDEGYELDTLKVVDKNGNKVAVSEKNGKYTFTMPASKVTVTAIFTEFEQPVVNPFTDVKESDYYYEAVQWALKNGITDGTSASTFSPNANCTRAQIVTFLWRAAGSPAPKNSENTFTDLKADAYYHDAVLWAAEQGITSGTGGGKFSPEAVCTRSQSVTLLYHAAGSPKVSENASFSDVNPDAYYAAAVAWAEQNGVTGGIGGGLFGSANDCTRGQIVTFLYRFFVK